MNPAAVIDLDHLHRYTGGDPALDAEIFALFREQCALWMRALESAGDAESWKAGTHALKGAARGVGAFAFAQACEDAETLAGEAGSRVSRAVALETVRSAMNEALAAIARLDQKAAGTFRAATSGSAT